jgi:hypothetical protein
VCVANSISPGFTHCSPQEFNLNCL